jgi:hypothetical protein
MKNWKTTLFGVLAAISIAVLPILQSGVIDWKAIMIAISVGLLGYFAKDHDVTGNATA